MTYHRTKLESGILGTNTAQTHHIVGQITKEQRHELYTTMCDVLTGKIITRTGETIPINDGSYQTILEIDKHIKLYYTKKNYKGQNNKGSFIVTTSLGNLFCKIYQTGNKTYSNYTDVEKEFKAMELLKHHNIETIDPIMYYKDGHHDVIIYPFIANMTNCADCLIDKNFPDEKKQYIIQYIQQISTTMKEYHVEDIKYLNAMYNHNNNKIYLFDCIYTGN